MRKRYKNESKTVLLIEDNPSWITLIRYSLPDSIRLDYVVTLQEGIEKISAYDVLILDLILPDSQDPLQTFLQVFRVTRETRLPIIVISAQDDINIQREILNYCVSGYIDKVKWDRKSFLDLLSKVINDPPIKSHEQQHQSLSYLLNSLHTSDIVSLTSFFL